MTEKQIQKQLKAFTSRIKEVQGSRTQREFASDAGVFQQNINRYRLGHTRPTLEILIRIAEAENVDLNWLILGVGRPYRNAVE